jgi:hypothetical protein
VEDGVSGWICRDAAEMAARAAAPGIAPESCRRWVSRHFARERMVGEYADVYQRALAGRGDALVREAAPSWKT